MAEANYVKHTVHTDALETYGVSGLTIGPRRDAIHQAVYRAVAGERLAPADHVVLDDDHWTAHMVAMGKGIGIVDPHLLQVLDEGEEFWLNLYPRQISSLEHVWEHPAFPPSPTLLATSAGPAEKQEAEMWVRDFCEEAGVRYNDVLDAISDWEKYGRQHGERIYISAISFAHKEPTDEFWDKLEILAERTIAPAERSFEFGCCA